MSVCKKAGSPFFWYDFAARGVRLRGSTGILFKDSKRRRSQAEAVEADLRRKARERGAQSISRDAPTLQDFSVEFLKWVDDTHSIEKETKRGYHAGWRLLSQTKLAALRMDEINNHDCETAKFPGSNWNANHALRTLRRMCSQAKELRLIFDIPKIELRKVHGRTVAMSQMDATKIAGKMPTGDPRDALLILRSTGMRPTECFSMRWEFFQWDSACYRNPSGKTNSSRRAIMLLGESLAILKNRHAKQGLPAEGWVFPAASKSGHLTTVAKAFTKARDAAGLPKAMCLYTARHGAGTDLAAVASLKTVMEALGHSSAQTAMIYQHPNVANLQARLDEARTNGRLM